MVCVCVRVCVSFLSKLNNQREIVSDISCNNPTFNLRSMSKYFELRFNQNTLIVEGKVGGCVVPWSIRYIKKRQKFTKFVCIMYYVNYNL